MSLYFEINGRRVTADELKANAPKKPRTVASGSSGGTHRGFRVVGHSPGSLEEARKYAETEFALWAGLTGEEQAKRIAKGARAPKAWDEAQWRKNAKATPVRSKPYEILSAAEQCKALAEKAGWIDVRIDSLQKGELTDAQRGFA